MQKGNTIRLISIIMFISFALCSCYSHGYRAFEQKWKPTTQVNTQWVSTGGDVVFHVSNDDAAAEGNYTTTGTIYVNNEIVEIYMHEGLGKACDMFIYPAEALKDEVIDTDKRYEHWVCEFKSEKEFVATVKETTFYKVGEILTFYRVDDGGESQKQATLCCLEGKAKSNRFTLSRKVNL